MEAIFETARNQVIQNRDEPKEMIFTQKEINLLELNRIKASLIPKQMDNHDRVFLEPKKQYDFVICPQTTDFKDFIATLSESIKKP